jgi:ketosteroid isomerase-like protein
MDTKETYRGREGFVDFWRGFRAAWEEITVSIERIEAVDDRVLTLGNFHGKGGESGAQVDAEAAWLHTIRDGLIVHLRSFSTWKEAREAAGLRE